MREMKPETEENKKKNSKAVPKNIDLPLGELRAEEDAPEENWNGSAGKDADAQEESCEDNTQLKIDEDAPTQEELEEERAYEARRAARAERLKQRKRRRKRKKIAILGLTTAAVLVLGSGIYFGDEFLSKIQEMEQMIEENRKAREEEKAKEASANKGEKETTPEVTEAPEKEELSEEAKAVILEAKGYAKQYDYDKAISILESSRLYDKTARIRKYAARYKKLKASCVAWPLEEITHVFYHSLVVDPAKAFDGDVKADGFNQVMTTIDEFNKITQSMYDKGYVMVSIKDMATADENGNMTPGEILLPPGKIPFVLSQDDVCYYHFMEGNGFASKLIVDEDGKIRNEYVEDDGSVSIGDYDMVPLIDRFVEEHPDFSYRGAKGVLALTGYNGILGYRSDISYQERPKDLDADKVQWLDAHPEFDLETERAGAKKVADALKEEGWLFASHTWGHQNIQEVSMERLERDTQRFKENVDPLIGGTDIIIFAFGADLNQSEDYHGEKFDFLKSQGYNYYCNVDSQKYFVQLRDNYLRMGRRNLDGYRMYYNPEMVEDLFTAGDVFDKTRPVPVPPMG